MVDCEARLTEEIFGRVKYMEDCMMIPGKKREMVGDFGIMNLEDRYRQKVKKDLVYEKSKMTMYIENIGRKINSNFGNFIKKHILDYVYSPDTDGNILCYDCDNCIACYKCVDCSYCDDTYNSIRTKYADMCSFNIDCTHMTYTHISKNCENCGNIHEGDDDKDLLMGRMLLDSCKACNKWCINLKNCVEYENCINCINCEEDEEDWDESDLDKVHTIYLGK